MERVLRISDKKGVASEIVKTWNWMLTIRRMPIRCEADPATTTDTSPGR